VADSEPKDSGTESAETSVNEGDAVEETPTETPSEEPAVAEEPEVATDEAPAAEEEAPAAEPEAAETPAEEAPAAEPEAPAAPPAVSGPKPKRKRLPRAERHKHSKPAREKPAKRKPITRTPKPETAPANRQERRGIVVSDKGEKTIVVKVDVTKLHPKYKKVVRRTRKFHAHDEQNAAGIGDVVRIVESRRISKTKNWRLAEVVEKAK
jgi:small subunit ribosomal protein S17